MSCVGSDSSKLNVYTKQSGLCLCKHTHGGKRHLGVITASRAANKTPPRVRLILPGDVGKNDEIVQISSSLVIKVSLNWI